MEVPYVFNLYTCNRKLKIETIVTFSSKDIPIGLLDDIYDFIRKFGQRLDEIEDVINENRLIKARTKGIGVITAQQALDLGLTYA